MKSIDDLRSCDSLGRFSIPKKLRDEIGIKEGDFLEIKQMGLLIVIQKTKAPEHESKTNLA
ncbi:AbrB/MazE/SpoVT family DNA-binding domain-containing protein [Aureibacillus halotolerans]|uniref:AbrB family looped-hinge helix DNA binding protein n=1 Tax=Aureibacillus halotolerans TaxID=1508390 RepID=A0A4R6U8S9_9BACI|nr:AbrB/MazE/SpoVT family DNA-binding domain-containing protein [Aureibacillus halotolerans]TDQ42216.1 AbrB family looped-hinge helix DNA binding protein [Aureibacillus halotolerans]